MAIQWTTSQKESSPNGIKILVHGPGGIGKTPLISTLPAPLAISVESGLLSLNEASQRKLYGTFIDVPVMRIENGQDFRDAYRFVTESTHARHFQSIALDSVTEIAEKILNSELKANKDGRKAYGEMGTIMSEYLRLFRDIPGKHVYFTAKQERFEDGDGFARYKPSVPGKILNNPGIEYFFDEVFSFEIGETADKLPFRFLRTSKTNTAYARDRSGVLNEIEEPHLGKIIQKIQSKLKTP